MQLHSTLECSEIKDTIMTKQLYNTFIFHIFYSLWTRKTPKYHFIWGAEDRLQQKSLQDYQPNC